MFHISLLYLKFLYIIIVLNFFTLLGFFSEGADPLAREVKRMESI